MSAKTIKELAVGDEVAITSGGFGGWTRIAKVEKVLSLHSVVAGRKFRRCESSLSIQAGDGALKSALKQGGVPIG